jgi:hypothetical protein
MYGKIYSIAHGTFMYGKIWSIAHEYKLTKKSNLMEKTVILCTVPTFIACGVRSVGAVALSSSPATSGTDVLEY